MTSPIPTPAVMFQGTGSDVGKSILVAGLCRLLARRGIAVRPFKPQNMSNNAAVTADGGEIGRAQWLQARAAGVPASVHMNPVLLKPDTESCAQIVVQGQVHSRVAAASYADVKPKLLAPVLASFNELRNQADLVLIEGAGSPAEVNLRAGDIANMGFAEAAGVPVILIGDIDRGGVLAAIVGTMQLLSPSERQRVKGYLINKFRGDPRLFEPAPDIIRQACGLDSLGIVPWFAAAVQLPAEDSLSLPRSGLDTGAPIRIVALRLPRLANADDLDPLRQEEDVDLHILEPGAPIPGNADLVILAGSKATLADLAVLKDCGWGIDLQAHIRRGGLVVGLCGGYQMLGRRVTDPEGMEGSPQSAAGLGLLDIETELAAEKTLSLVTGEAVAERLPVQGFEIHIGRSWGADTQRPMLMLNRNGQQEPDGARSADGRVMGTYVHGLFTDDRFRRTFLNRIHRREGAVQHYWRLVDETLDHLADHLEDAVAVDQILDIAAQR